MAHDNGINIQMVLCRKKIPYSCFRGNTDSWLACHLYLGFICGHLFDKGLWQFLRHFALRCFVTAPFTCLIIELNTSVCTYLSLSGLQAPQGQEPWPHSSCSLIVGLECVLSDYNIGVPSSDVFYSCQWGPKHLVIIRGKTRYWDKANPQIK